MPAHRSLPTAAGAAVRAAARTPPLEWALAVGAVAVCTALALPFRGTLRLTDIAMLYLLGCVLVASRAGHPPTALATLLAVVGFDYLFVPPHGHFSITNPRYLFTLSVMFLVTSVVCRLTLRVRAQAAEARRNEDRMRVLFRLSSDLAGGRGVLALGRLALRHCAEAAGAPCFAFFPDGAGRLLPHPEALPPGGESLHAAARWAFEHRLPAGPGTGRHEEIPALLFPLATEERSVGVLGVQVAGGAGPPEEGLASLLWNFANQASSAIARTMLAEEAQRAAVRAERESVRSTMLSSISHDLRTPLAAITGASTALLDGGDSLPPAARRELHEAIALESARLGSIIRNVLDMTRVESDTLAIRSDWQSLEELAGAAIEALGDALAGRDLAVSIPEDLPLVSCDPLLVGQALTNLLENAAKHTPAGTPVALSARREGMAVVVEVADRGPGVSAGEERRIFSKFVRGPAAGGGIGLGLAICTAIVEAHGGRIWVEPRAGGGAAFRFTLPLQPAPPSGPVSGAAP